MLEGVRVVELATHVFVPSGAAVLADWGADVVRIQHPAYGDPLAGMLSGTAGGVNFWLEQANRNKRSICIDVATEKGRALLLRMVEQADVFITNFLEPARERLRVTYEDLSAVNPRLVYARGNGQGHRGPDAARAGFDAVSFWARGGIGGSLTAPGAPFVRQRAAFGDVQGGGWLAAGISAGLYRAAKTGKGCLVDVSLLGTAVWVLAPDLIRAHILQDPKSHLTTASSGPRNPLVELYLTRDRRFVQLMMMEADRYWPGFCRAIDRPDLIAAPLYADFHARDRNADALVKVIGEQIATRTLDEWAAPFVANEVIYAPVQVPLEVTHDPQVVANGYLPQHPSLPHVRLAAPPVQFDNQLPAIARGAPEHGAHTEEVLLALGLDWEEIIALKEENVIN